ncbi:MAG: aminopeptidase P N-terminal domain-containing protein [Pseudomonadota bacterium]|nr:aminopeptidase P N-terminal domain-containing protein [Pseudomonadota bacterium]
MSPVRAAARRKPVQDHRAHQQRRRRLQRLIGDGIAFIPTAPEYLRNADTHFPFRFDSHFWYLTGFGEPEAVLVLIGGRTPRSLLFCRDRDAEREIWDGHRYGPREAQKVFGVDEAHSITRLDAMAPELIAGQRRLLHPLGLDAGFDVRVNGWLAAVRAKVRAGVAAPGEFADVRQLIDGMRLVKERSEITLMQKAADISARAHVRAMQVTRPGMHEYEIEAELLHEFRRSGAQSPAYPSIVAGGANACVLHYVGNDAPLRDGDLLLIDAGCEVDGYAADITRTFPVNGRFSPAQRDCYQLVLEAQAAAIRAVKPGAAFTAYHQAALKVLAQGMIDLKLLKGPLDRVLESGDYRQFYMHRTGHWLGLDVHDVGTYAEQGKPRRLTPGNVLTVEPGLYIRPDAKVAREFWNIGIRIEDDVLVTADGRKVLTAATPKGVEQIEALMADD